MSTEIPRLDLVVFSSVARNPLLRETLRSLRAQEHVGQFSRKILAVDGLGGRGASEDYLSWFDQVVTTVAPSGYFANIEQGLSLVRSEFVFWLEDDWSLTKLPAARQALSYFESQAGLMQLRLPKHDYLLREDKSLGMLSPGIWAQGDFYSFNPHFARADFLRRAFFGELRQQFIGQNVEQALSAMLRAEGGISACFEPTFAMAIHRGGDYGQGATDYATHLIPPPAHAAQKCSVQSIREDVSVDVPAPPRLRQPRRPWAELPLKAAFAIAASFAATLLAPFSRQSRSFIRRVWAYWIPDRRQPSFGGVSRLDQEQRNRGASAAERNP